jgi:hypothetical protein
VIRVNFYNSFCGFWVKRALDLRRNAPAGLLVLNLLLLSQSGWTSKSSTVTRDIIQVVAGNGAFSIVCPSFYIDWAVCGILPTLSGQLLYYDICLFHLCGYSHL